MSMTSLSESGYHRYPSMRMILALSFLAVGAKLLLMQAYRSTDFEVHRNWMAITNSLPLSRWYFEDRSLWTLDYPPFFAYFEFLLGQFAQLFDSNMVKVENLDYASFATIAFQRCSVIATDLVYVVFAYFLPLQQCHACDSTSGFNQWVLLVFNAGLLFVDHMHFQYNGVLMGLLLCSLWFAKYNRLAGLVLSFSVLVFMKHLFAPLGLVFAGFILKRCLLRDLNKPQLGFNWMQGGLKLFGLCCIALLVVALAMGPFVVLPDGKEQLIQIFSRLFPFGRGLVHAYWAPNMWAMYCFADKILSIVQTKLNGGIIGQAAVGFNSTSGLVGDFSFAILPRITAAHCMGLVVLLSIPAVVTVFLHHSYVRLVRGLVYASLTSFMWGYHVHEKAITIPWILQTLLSGKSELDSLFYILLSASSMAGLFPLLPGYFELLIKFAIYLAFLSSSMNLLNFKEMQKSTKWVLVILLGLLTVCLLYTEIFHWFLFRNADGSTSLPFLPLMMTSVVSAVYNAALWGISFYLLVFHERE